jgi:outer membrane protein assembly factor BamD (BamD/ComL family)
VDNGRYGETLFHFYQDDYFTAITHLLAARAQSRITLDWDEAELLLGGMKLSYGLTNAAENIFLRLLEREPSEAVRQQAWYYLARLAYEKGRLDQAANALVQMGDRLPPALRGKQQLLNALVRMEQGDFAGAAAALEPWQGLAEDEPYARYNLGVALVRSDRIDEGSAILAELGELRPRNEEARALRDKAHLARARALLKTQPQLAKQSLQNIRLQGPLSNEALLGAGWAEVVAGNYAAALTPWEELIRRDVADPAVQEAMLALPYALIQLEARDQAAERYQDAIARLDAETARLDEAMAAVRDGQLLQAALQIDPRGDELPPIEQVPGRAYLGTLLSSHAFRRALQDYQEIQSLQANLRYWQERMDEYDQILAANRTRFDERMAAREAESTPQQTAALTARRAELRATDATALEQIDAGLVRLRDQQAELSALTAEAAKNFRGLGGRIALQRDRIERLLPRLETALAQRHKLLELRALQTLGERRDSLRSQVTQARFALAQLYDPATARPGRTE